VRLACKLLYISFYTFTDERTVKQPENVIPLALFLTAFEIINLLTLHYIKA